MLVLLAVDAEDAAAYLKNHRGPVLDARVILLSEHRKAEGLRVTGGYATPLARAHADYRPAFRSAYYSYLLTTREAPRIF